MTKLPVSHPTPIHRETLHSYLARLAETWRTSAPEIARDMGASFKRLLNEDEKAFQALSAWVGLSDEVMTEMRSWTGVRAGNVRMEFRGELYVSRALRNPVMRGCPVCLREDAKDVIGPKYGAMVMRGDWQLRHQTLCIRHGHPLIPLWHVASPRDRFDIGARLREIEPKILSGELDLPRRIPSAYDLWLDDRLEKGVDKTWLSDHPVFVVATICGLLGQAISKEKDQEDVGISGENYAAGFDVVVAGEKAIQRAFNKIAANATERSDEPGRVFGPLYTKLNYDYLKEQKFDPFRKILRECILRHWPIASGELVLGEVLPQRRLHSLRTAALEAQIGVAVLEPFLIEAGALKANDRRLPSRRLFDAQAYAELLKEIPTLVGPIAMRNAMGATKQELIGLAKEGVLNPRTRVEKVKNPWRISDGVALVNELSDNAVVVEDEEKGWHTLLIASRVSGVTLHTLIQEIRNGRLTVGKRSGVFGFHGLVVSKAQVDALAAPSRTARDSVLDEMPGSMAAAAFGRSVGLRAGGVFLAMIEAGHVPAYQIINPRTERPQYRMTAEHMSAFHRRFVTLTTLSAETGLHVNALKRIIAARKCPRFSPNGRDFGVVYLRADVVEALK